MPGLNGTGPMGNGPMTGGGRGLCNPVNQGFERQFSGASSGFGRGMGFGRGFRGGMGMRRGFGRDTFQNQPAYSGITADELNTLKYETASVKSMLETISRKITELEQAL